MGSGRRAPGRRGSLGTTRALGRSTDAQARRQLLEMSRNLGAPAPGQEVVTLDSSHPTVNYAMTGRPMVELFGVRDLREYNEKSNFMFF